MPFWNLQEQLGVNVDKWMVQQSSEQPYKRASRCHAFEKEWIECASGIGRTRARKECNLEYEDLEECVTRRKMITRMITILAQKKQLIKEGKYTSPGHHSGEPETRP